MEGRPKLKMLNFSILPQAGEQELTKEQLFDALWDRAVEQLERLG